MPEGFNTWVRGVRLVAHIATIAFQGIETLAIDVQVQLTPGMPMFSVVGLPDKAVAESRERVRAALHAIGLALPPKRITVNLSPADVQKEGSHFDLPIALAILVAMEVLDAETLERYVALGELGLDGRLAPIQGALNAAIGANAQDRGLICPAANGPEAALGGNGDLVAPSNLMQLINHFKGSQLIAAPNPPELLEDADTGLDLMDIKGQETAKRALEIAAAGAHNLLMIGPPGSGKSMLAQRLPSILPPLDAAEALELSMIRSVAGNAQAQGFTRLRPFRDPHHSASLPALIGGGTRAKPGEISLAHNGVLFLDELPEFHRAALEALRQPLETGQAVVARANAHVRYPARVQMVAAMNPCRCGHLDDPAIACKRAPACALDYQAKISGPLFDRIDLHVEVAAVSPADLSLPPPAEGSREVAARVAAVRRVQRERYAALGQPIRTNAEADGRLLEEVAAPDARGRELLTEAAGALKLSARGYHRVLRVARTLADMAGREQITRIDIAEALSYRRVRPGGTG